MAKFAVGVIVVVYLTERGFPLYQATLAAGGVGLFQVLGRVLVTVLRARLPEHVVVSLLFLAQAAGILAPLLTSGHGAAATASVVVFVVLFGLGYGLTGLMRGTLVADYYGPANFPSINGVIALFVIAGQAVGPLLAGLLGAFGGYEPVLVTAAVLAAASVPALVRAHRTRPGQPA
jgi:MFS family permease